MSLWLLCALGFVAMVSEDILYTIMTQAQNRHRPYLAGLMDTLGYLAQFVVFGVGIESLIKNGLTGRTILILAVLSAANFVGTALGTLLGDRWMHAENLTG
jgi:hypothetical protein